MFSDLRFALRSLAKTPGFTAVAVLTLALGIGLVTVQLSFIYGALIKGLPFEGAERIQAVEMRNAADTRPVMTTLRHFAMLQERQRSFEFLGAYRGNGLNVSGADLFPRRYPGVECTAGLFALTGVTPQLGRTVQPADSLPGAPRVLVLGAEVWKNDFAGDPAVVGRAVRVDGRPATIVGVMPAGFAFPLREQVWSNLPVAPAAAQDWYDYVDVVGRLRADTTLAQARSEFAVLAADIARDGPKRENFGARFTIGPFAGRQAGALNNILWILLAMVGAVLVLACLNVANLLYVRAVRQRHELAVRLALGAGRGLLVRQALTMSMVLASLGAVAGMVLAVWSVPVLNHFLTDPQKPYWITLDLDGRVLAATVALTLVVGVVAGLLPALRSLRIDPIATLRDGGHGSTGYAAGRMSRWLTIGQIVLSTAVLVVAAVLSRGVYQAGSGCYPGDASRVLVAATVFQSTGAGTDAASRDARHRRSRAALLGGSAALPGVEVAALTTREPHRRAMPMPVEIEGGATVPAKNRDQVSTEWISPGYFQLFAMSPLRGRLFTDADRAGGEPVAIVNESFARRYWPGEDAVGKRCRFEDTENEPQWHTVIGVVADLPMAGVELDRHEPGVYLPLHETSATRVNLLLRTAGEPLALARPLKQLLQQLAPDQPFQSMLTLEALIDQRLRLARLISSLALVFGGTAALLAAVGIFGVTAFLVERRRREFGVRLALGAPPGEILALVLRRGLGQLAFGLAGGLALGWALNRPLQSIPMLRTVARADAGDFVLVAILIAASVLFSCWLPSRRAARINPLVALRME